MLFLNEWKYTENKLWFHDVISLIQPKELGAIAGFLKTLTEENNGLIIFLKKKYAIIGYIIIHSTIIFESKASNTYSILEQNVFDSEEADASNVSELCRLLKNA